MSSIQFNFDGFNNLLKSFAQSRALVVRVGLFSDKASRTEAIGKAGKSGIRKTSTTKDDKTNAEIGAKMEFGSYSEGIPARSWLHMPIEIKGDEIMKNAAVGAEKLVGAGKMDTVFKRVGIAAEAAIQEAFETKGFGTWADNAPRTIAEKGSSMPLIDTGQLRRAVTSKVVVK